jgi:heme oxygenase (biliverdin-IX-beta and delta-forming)
MLADELKEVTRDVHAALEKKLLTHIQVVADANRYQALLILMYGFYAAVEYQLERFKHGIPDYDLRRKSHAILQDLRQLGFSTDTLPICNDAPSINSLPSALGAMYVLEGSTLGGRIITKMLLKQVPSLEGSTTFFQGYDDQTMEMWQKFKTYLQGLVTREEYEKAHHAANETFVKFKQWIEYNDAN